MDMIFHVDNITHVYFFKISILFSFINVNFRMIYDPLKYNRVQVSSAILKEQKEKSFG
jgi:hypothetical protein